MSDWPFLIISVFFFSCCLAGAAWCSFHLARGQGGWGRSFAARLLEKKISSAEDYGLTRKYAISLLASVVVVPPLLALLFFWGSVTLFFLFCGLSFYTPTLVWRLLRGRYLRALEAQLPDALEMIASSVSAGHTVTQAFELAGSELAYPMRRVFDRVTRELKLGSGMPEVLARLKLRVPLGEMSLAVVAILVARESGGDLPEVLRKVSATANERAKIRGKIKALTAQGVLSGWVVGLAPVFLLGAIYLLEPEYVMPLFNTTFGMGVLVFSAFMQVLGLFSIRRIVNVRI